MADRISSESVSTVRATLAETAVGIRVDVPSDEAAAFPVDSGEVVRIVLDEDERFARVDQDVRGETIISGVYERPDGARDPRTGTDHLPGWVDTHGVRIGGSLLIDVIEPGFLYGFRAPGETAVYDAREPPSSSLQDIASSLEES